MLDIDDVLQVVYIEALGREEPASRIDCIAVVTDDAARLAIHSDCAGRLMASQEERAEDKITSVIAVDREGAVADIRRPSRALRTQISDVVAGSELPNVAVADERVRIYGVERSFHILTFKFFL
ncbi:hypothetical protein [Paraburkholderia terricola]|uniref:hypothetical protein n=1 Tax=Paraburkholderia terricola TaxID=169427 RepID=UPI00285570ED|nr:hypothetical protein [Paraburkholderia terricola]MDR6480577.1 hypothetical protein [Paraburkholderia terricola]